jgi:hypothetical protein
MPVPETKAAFAELESRLGAPALAAKKWKLLALTVDEATPAWLGVSNFYEAAKTCHYVENMRRYVDKGQDATYEQEAFAHALAAIELAPVDAQADAIDMVIGTLFSMKKNHERDYYTNMLNELGPRLRPVNQPKLLLFIIDNVITKIDGDSYVRMSDNLDPNGYIKKYNKDIRAQVAETYAEEISTSPHNMIYDTPVVAWILSMADQKNSRFLRNIECPNTGNKPTPYSIWIAPNPEHESEVLFVDTANPTQSKNANMLRGTFNEILAKGTTTKDTKAQIQDMITNLTLLFSRAALSCEKNPEFKNALTLAKDTFANHEYK